MSARRPDDPVDLHSDDVPEPKLAPAGASAPVIYPVDAEPPEIAPPLLLEPIPPPTLLGATIDESEAEADAPPDDAYSWAAEAASSMERSGRSFDVLDDIPPPPPSRAPLTTDPNPPAHTGAASARASAPAPAQPAPADHVIPTRKRHRPPRKASGGNKTVVWLMGLAFIVFMAIAGVSMIALVMTMSGGGDGSDVLQPVSPAVDARPVPQTTRPKFAIPTRDLPRPPGSSVDFDPNADEPEVVELRVDERGRLIGRVKIQSTPSGAVIKVNDRIYGYTPADIDLTYGTHRVTLSLEGHEEEAVSVVIEEPLTAYELPLTPRQP